MTKRQLSKPKTQIFARLLVQQLETGGRVILSKNSNSKTSDLILEVSRMLKRKGFAVCHADFNGSKNSIQFLERLHAAYYSGFFPKQTDLNKYKSDALKKMILQYDQLKGSSDLLIKKPDTSFFDFSKADWSRTMDLVEKLAKRLKKKPVVFLENFDVLCRFKDSMDLQEKLRSRIQHHHKVSYCYSVSSIDRERKIFFSYDAPFYLSALKVDFNLLAP
jgi:hypothetical protein